ncbi:methionine--tRNA ligase [Candidatus Peregrinibacteria bacterium]|nr:methionine--tRNA ligase [Candidatus Peregrinibacteria bacterium]
MSKRRYITTAIDYPNAAPHMGHVLEKVLADVIARWWRLSGDAVRFQIGTDEHGVKIQQTADREKVTPQELVDRNVPIFQKLYEDLGISADVFIRTTDKKKHWPTVAALWRKLSDAGALEKRTYTGLYCSGCERFVTAKDLIDGKCPDHGIVPTQVKEENWFFLLKKEEQWLKKLLKDSYTIVPSSRAHETLSLLEAGLEDVSFSRPKSSLAWGIPVPGDEDQTMYVWCDALTNYISGIDYFGLAEGHERGPKGRVEWWDDAEVTHVIGKDIARFHALIWPAMLKNADVRTPDRLLIHGFLTSEGQKMSKSVGNVVVPQEVIAKYGVEPLRFYLSHEIPVGNDGDFSWKRFGELYDAKLRNQLGNLLNRVLVLLQKEGGTIDLEVTKEDVKSAAESRKKYEEHMNAFELSQAMQFAFEQVACMNVFINEQKPWEKSGAEKTQTLSVLAESLRQISLLLLPFLPQTAQEISLQLNVPYAKKMLGNDFVITNEMKEWGSQTKWKKVGKPKILFAPVE